MQLVAGAIAEALVRPCQQVEDFLLGLDISMLWVLSPTYKVVPEEQPDMPLNEFKSPVLPLPGVLWRTGFYDAQTNLFQLLFSGAAATIRHGNGPSIGGLYTDSELIGVAAYVALTGVALRELRECNSGSWAVTFLFSALLPMIVLLLRGRISDTSGRAVHLTGPYPFTAWVALQRRGALA